MIYEYVCPNCSTEEVINHGMTESPDVRCAKCGHVMGRRITGGQGTIFKGAGFPGNDMKKKDQYFKEQEKHEREARTKKPWELV